MGNDFKKVINQVAEGLINKLTEHLILNRHTFAKSEHHLITPAINIKGKKQLNQQKNSAIKRQLLPKPNQLNNDQANWMLHICKQGIKNAC